MAKTGKNPYSELITADANISQILKNQMKGLSILFYDSTEYIRNLRLSAPELAEKYNGDIEGWRTFIEYPTIAKFIADELEKMLKGKALDALLDGELKVSDAYKIDKDIRGREQGLDNSNIVVMLLPQKKSAIKTG